MGYDYLYYRYYPMEDIRLPPNDHLPAVFPEIAWSTFADLRGYADMIPLNDGGNMFNKTYTPEKVKSLRRAYYSAVSYIDSLVGEVRFKVNCILSMYVTMP